MLAYVDPARIARTSSANSPTAMPWAVGPITLAAVRVPETTPSPAGQAGAGAVAGPPPHRKTLTPPVWLLPPRWRWAWTTLVSRFFQLSRYEMDWSRSLIVATKVADPGVENASGSSS